ncbi:MAG: sulfatase [Anaerolineales bacterium]|nr:sulfatase [Anaerolineales bacterium]
MGSSKVSRRDFLKVMGLSSVLLLPGALHKSKERQGLDLNLPNILIILFDALSAKNISLQGYPRRTMPNLERLAERATVFHRHYAGGNFTTPGTASLLTGSYPWSHRALNVHGTVTNAYVERNIFNLLSPKYNTFAVTHNPLVNKFLHQFNGGIDQLARASDIALLSRSYADQRLFRDFNAAYDAEVLIFRNGYSPTSSFFLGRFERAARYLSSLSLSAAYARQFPKGLPNHWDEVEPSYIYFTLEQSVDWIARHVEGQAEPFLGYVHLLPPHYPFNARRDCLGLFDDDWTPVQKPERWFSEGRSQDFLNEERRAYDEFIAYVDAEFARLYELLERMGALENTYLILTSDHGEMFERGIYTHTTQTLYEPILNIPLIVWRPGQTQRCDVDTPTSCVDVLPTLLHLAGEPAPDWCEGRVLPAFSQQEGDVDRSIFAVEAKENPWHAPLYKFSAAMVKGPYKLVHYFGYGGDLDAYEFFDVEQDPEEMQDLYPSLPPVVRQMRDELIEKLAQVNHPYQ